MKLSLPSAFLGAGVAILVFLAFGFQFTAKPINPPIVVEGVPTPGQMIQITELQSLMVPPGKLFVVTGLGSFKNSGGSGITLLRFDGVETVRVNITTSTGNGSTVKLIPPGLTAPAGTLVEVLGGDSTPDDARCWGYLADA